MRSAGAAIAAALAVAQMCQSADLAAPAAGGATDKSVRDLMFMSLMDTHLFNITTEVEKKKKTPKVGGKCFFEIAAGGKVQGILVERTPRRVVVKEEYGKVTYPANRLSKAYWPIYFPVLAARERALKEMAEMTRKKVKQAAKASPGYFAWMDDPAPDPAPAPAKVGSPATRKAAQPAPAPRGPPPVYDTSPAPTPAELEPALKEFGSWVSYRAPGMLEQVHAKRQGRHAVLYAKASAKFLELPPEDQEILAESMWTMWGFRCEDHNSAYMANAHLVVAGPNGNPVAGSTPTDSSLIWAGKR